MLSIFSLSLDKEKPTSVIKSERTDQWLAEDSRGKKNLMSLFEANFYTGDFVVPTFYVLVFVIFNSIFSFSFVPSAATQRHKTMS